MEHILIVGSPRTGTTALALGLQAAGISGFSEGHILMLFVRIEQTIAKYYQDEASNNLPGTLLHALPMPKLVLAYRDLARSIVDEAHDNKPWFDKTAHGGMVGCLPFFRSMWPDAKIMFTKRRPIENLQSRLKKFPHMSFTEHCIDLRYVFLTWAKMRDQMSNWLEVDQYDLATKCEATSTAIANFLDLDPCSAEAFYQTVLNTHPERSAFSYEPLKFSELEWGADEKETFTAQLDDVMKIFNYGYDNYFTEQVY
jgi:hypothetical protein